MMRTTPSMSNRRRETAVDPPPNPSVDRRVTRSMSNRRLRETAPANPSVDRRVIRSMSNRRRETAVDPPAKRSTRMMSNPSVDPPSRKRMYPLMPLPDLRRRFSANRQTSALLKKQFKEVMASIKRQESEGYRPPTVIDRSRIRSYHSSRMRHTSETTDEFFSICGLCPPITPQDAEVARHRTLANVMSVVARNITLPQKDLVSLFPVSRRVYNALLSLDNIHIWRCLDFRGMNKAGDRLVEALSMPRYHHVVEDINLEFAQDIEDKHLKLLKTKCGSSVGFLESLNLSGCQMISNRGVKDITSICPRLKRFSIQCNSRVTDLSMQYLAKNCKFLTDLNLRGCEKITDRCLKTLYENCSDTLTALDVNGCTGIEGRSHDELLRLFPNLRCFSTC